MHISKSFSPPKWFYVYQHCNVFGFVFLCSVCSILPNIDHPQGCKQLEQFRFQHFLGSTSNYHCSVDGAARNKKFAWHFIHEEQWEPTPRLLNFEFVAPATVPCAPTVHVHKDGEWRGGVGWGRTTIFSHSNVPPGTHHCWVKGLYGT